MKVALITVGDELLAGDTTDTNATWLAAKLNERGATVSRILSLPDERNTITERVKAYSGQFDAVIVTGGIGGTPDDITMEAVAAAFDRELAPTELTLSDVTETIAAFAERRPSLDIDIDAEAEAAIPEGSRPLLNEQGLAPGCVLENVYVLPGIPEELEAMFEQVAGEFSGERRSQFLYTTEPEANIVGTLEETMERFDVTVGCYPDRDAGHNRLKIVGTDEDELDDAADWLLSTIDASETPVSRDW